MLLNAVTVFAATPAATTGNSGGFDITQLFLPLMLAFLVYLMWNGGRKRKKAEAELRSSLGVGAKVILHSGITGTIVAIDDVSATIESTPKTKLRVVLGAIRGIDTSLDQPVAEPKATEVADDSSDSK